MLKGETKSPGSEKKKSGLKRKKEKKKESNFLEMVTA